MCSTHIVLRKAEWIIWKRGSRVAAARLKISIMESFSGGSVEVSGALSSIIGHYRRLLLTGQAKYFTASSLFKVNLAILCHAKAQTQMKTQTQKYKWKQKYKHRWKHKNKGSWPILTMQAKFVIACSILYLIRKCPASYRSMIHKIRKLHSHLNPFTQIEEMQSNIDASMQRPNLPGLLSNYIWKPKLSQIVMHTWWKIHWWYQRGFIWHVISFCILRGFM